MIKCNKGLTLVELVVSLAILGIIIAPLSSFFVNTIRINKNSEDRLTANQIAQKYMEEAKFGKKSPSTGTITKTDQDFKTQIKIEQQSKYKIDKEMKKEVSEGEKNKDKNNSITYHAEIEIDKDDTQSDKVTFKATDSGNQDELISNDQEIKIDIKKDHDNKITIKLNKKYTKTVTNIDLDNNNINIKIKCNGNRSPINLDVSTLNNPKTNIYIVKSKTTKNKIKLNTTQGKVRLYNNIYDESVSRDEESWIYKITVTVTKNGKELAKLVGYKNID